MTTKHWMAFVGTAMVLAVQAAARADDSYIVTQNPSALSTATITTNYSQVQTYTEPLGFSSTTFQQSPDVYWFTYVSDGQTAVRFDTLGSNFGTTGSGSVLGISNDSQVAVYNTSGSLLAISKNTVDLSGNPIAIYPTFSSDKGSGASNTTLGTNQYSAEGLSQVYFAPTASTNPNWTVSPNDPTPYTGWAAPGNAGNSQEYYPPNYPTSLNEYHVWSTALSPIVLDNNGNPVLDDDGDTIPQPGWRYYDYARVGPGSTWNRYQVLPAGTYYIAVTSGGPVLSGDTDSVTLLQQPIYYNYSTNTDTPDISAPMTGFEYYLDPTGTLQSGTIQLNVTQAPVVTQNVATLTGSATMTLNATTLVVSNGGTFDGVLQDGTFQGLLVVTGGTLTLTGANTFSGGTTLSGSGTLSVSSDANLGDPTGAVSFDGGTLEITGTTYTATTRPIYWDANGGGFNISDPANTFTINSALTGGGLTKSGAGALVLAQAYSTAAPTVISGGTLQLAGTPNLAGGISGTGTLVVAAGASLTSDGIRTGGLTIAGSVQIRSNGTATGTSKVSALSVTGSLDLTNNALIVESDDLTKSTAIAALQGEVAAGAGQTTGIFSTTLSADEAIAVVDNGSFATPLLTYNGQNVDKDSIIVTPALLGDANIDGTVDLNDLNTVLNHLGTTSSAWNQGNFDGASTVDLNDLNDVLNHLGVSLPGAPTAELSASRSPVPEPASLAILLAGATGLLFNRKKR